MPIRGGPAAPKYLPLPPETRQAHQVYSTEQMKAILSLSAVMEEAAVLKAGRPTSDWPRDIIVSNTYHFNCNSLD